MILGHMWKYYGYIEPSDYDRWLMRYYSRQAHYKFKNFSY
jgi:hypothetical protein